MLSVRIQQENPRRVHRPDDNDRLYKGEILSSDSYSLSTSCLPMLAAAANCCRISPEADGESVCLPVPLRVLTLVEKTITSVKTARIRVLASFVFSSHVELLFGFRLDQWFAKSYCMNQ